jgi:hypothetical protein
MPTPFAARDPGVDMLSAQGRAIVVAEAADATTRLRLPADACARSPQPPAPAVRVAVPGRERP